MNCWHKYLEETQMEAGLNRQLQGGFEPLVRSVYLLACHAVVGVEARACV